MRGNENPAVVRKRFDEYLRSNNKRRTAERFAILEMVLKMPGHFSAETLSDLMKKDEFPVSVATVYSTLELLVEFGLLVRQRFSDKACLFEKASFSLSGMHHHLICTVCGKIKEVKDAVFTRHIEERKFQGFCQSYYTLNIYGICGACSRKNKRKNKTEK